MSDVSSLIDLLSSKTNEGKLRWRLEGSCITTTQANTVVDIYVPAWLDTPDVNRIVVRNRDGVTLAQEEFSRAYSEHAVLAEIHGSVRRETLGVDKALDDLRSSLLRL